MPPEEQFGYPLTEASDLYSLGATLICLLTRTRSVNIGQILDAKHRLNFQKLIPQISPCFRSWLMKMVAQKRQHRYANAAIALEVLKPIPVIGNATSLETLVATVKSRKKTFVLGLAAIGTLAVAGAKFMITQSAVVNKQVLEARECQSLNSTSNCLDKNRH
jgi:serine/threonine protein kinase